MSLILTDFFYTCNGHINTLTLFGLVKCFGSLFVKHILLTDRNAPNVFSYKKLFSGKCAWWYFRSSKLFNYTISVILKYFLNERK